MHTFRTDLWKIYDQCKTIEINSFVWLFFNLYYIDCFISSSHCHLSVDEFLGMCVNIQCPSSSEVELSSSDKVFDIRITLMDHTGCIENCRLTAAAARSALQCSVSINYLEGYAKGILTVIHVVCIYKYCFKIWQYQHTLSHKWQPRTQEGNLFITEMSEILK